MKYKEKYKYSNFYEWLEEIFNIVMLGKIN